VPPIASTRGDADRLKQAVWNLLSNAVKFTAHGGRVDVRLDVQENEQVVSVRDTGIGIPANFLPSVFDPFRQADASATRRHGGLGLGLALTRQIMELHGGRVTAESDGEGRGAIFCLHVPVHPSRGVDASPPADVSAQALAGKHVMIVDDDRDARELFKTLVTRQGATASVFESVTAALAGLAAARPDVVISDLAMPDEDGYALLRRLRASSEPAFTTVPVIAVTALSGPVERQQALAEGFADHIGKPVLAERLIAAIRRATAPPAR
jgi:CheY-like chemotaxis protein/anti-sigma regulatory factor (Ser/Thr protein kinase)